MTADLRPVLLDLIEKVTKKANEAEPSPHVRCSCGCEWHGDYATRPEIDRHHRQKEGHVVTESNEDDAYKPLSAKRLLPLLALALKGLDAEAQRQAHTSGPLTKWFDESEENR